MRMSAAVDSSSADTGESDARQFYSDPGAFFGESHTATHSIDRGTLVELQVAGLKQRFTEQVERIPMVAKLAARQGITSVDDFDEIVPLLFEHTMYKSYPIALLERRQFGRLSSWLDKLTSVDVAAVDTSGCDSIQGWVELLSEQTDLDMLYSSGTSGTMSFFPWTSQEVAQRARLQRICELQPFGTEPTELSLRTPVHRIGSPARTRRDYEGEALTFGDPNLLHIRASRRSDADLLWLAARMRNAAARGDASRIDVPESLLARRSELEEAHVDSAASDEAWLAEIEKLQGEHIVWNSFPADMLGFAQPRVEAGIRWSFAPGSVVKVIGGAKGQVLPPDWMDTIARFTDARIFQGYGMVEMSHLNLRCSNDRYHLQPWLIPYILDPESSHLLPRKGVQTGRLAFFDLMPFAHWGGLMTGDEVEIDFDEPCGCGQTTYHLSSKIARLSEKRGGDDKISCAATPEAYAEAMQFLTGL
jgi:hypothetical protein